MLKTLSTGENSLTVPKNCAEDTNIIKTIKILIYRAR